jgi:hypothetical protein
MDSYCSLLKTVTTVPKTLMAIVKTSTNSQQLRRGSKSIPTFLFHPAHLWPNQLWQRGGWAGRHLVNLPPPKNPCAAILQSAIRIPKTQVHLSFSAALLR